MKILRIILRTLAGGLFWILIACWAIFVFYSIVYFVEGGPDRVVHWYMHISGSMKILSVSNGTAVVRLTPWNPRRFLATQIAILGITIALFFLRRRLRDQTGRAMSKP
jgi:hypothetical protein